MRRAGRRRCFLWFHDWGRWRYAGEWGIMAYQTRECLTCGRIQQKEIGYITRFSATAAPPPSSLSAQALVQAAYPDEPNERDEDDEEDEDED